MKNIIHDLRDELERAKTENGKLVTSINEERKVSEDLKSGLESLHGVDQQIAKQEQLITGKFFGSNHSPSYHYLVHTED